MILSWSCEAWNVLVCKGRCKNVTNLSYFILHFVLVELNTVLEREKIETTVLVVRTLGPDAKVRTHLPIRDGHTFGFDGGSPGDPETSFLQRQFAVRVGWMLRGRPEPVGCCESISCHIDLSHHVGQLRMVLGVYRWCPATAVCTNHDLLPKGWSNHPSHNDVRFKEFCITGNMVKKWSFIIILIIIIHSIL